MMSLEKREKKGCITHLLTEEGRDTPQPYFINTSKESQISIYSDQKNVEKADEKTKLGLIKVHDIKP